MFCHVSSEQVFGVHDVTSVYHVPLLLQSQGIVQYLRKRLNLDKLTITKEMTEKGASLGKRWRDLTTGYVGLHLYMFSFSYLVSSQERLFDTVTIALVGKYTDLKDSYMSVTKALEHSAFRVHRKLIVQVSLPFITLPNEF
jgi:CTP synthase